MTSIPGIDIGHNFTVRIGRGNPVVFTEVTGWQDITFPDQQRGEIEVTHNKSPAETEEFILALKAATDWQAMMLYVQGDARDVLMRDLYLSRETFVLELTPKKSLPDNALNGVPVQWAALLKGYAPTLPIKGAMMSQATMKIMGELETVVTEGSGNEGSGG